jgi:K+-sensing histidine kinase KdpD
MLLVLPAQNVASPDPRGDIMSADSERDIHTWFAPAERVDDHAIAQLREQIDADPLVGGILRALGGFVAVLNEQRQVLAANQGLVDALGVEDPSCVMGLRPGEMLDCVFHAEAPGGCGTSTHCRTCGAVLAILQSQANGVPAEGDCRLSTRRDSVIDTRSYRVRANPLRIGDTTFTLLVMHDVTQDVRRAHLDSTLVHELLDQLSNVQGLPELLSREGASAVAESLVTTSLEVKRRIALHELLRQAESGELQPRFGPLRVGELLELLLERMADRACAQDRHLVVDPVDPEATLRSDRDLLLVLLGAMAENALEATPPGGTVRIGFTTERDRPTFQLHNVGTMHPAVSERVFEPGFSTHDQPHRGQGSVVMKLLGEGLLGGQVGFDSSREQGTVFRLTLPVLSEDRPSADPPQDFDPQLPPELRQRLLRAIRRGHLDTARELLSELGEQAPATERAFSAMLEAYDHAGLLRLLDAGEE